MMLKAVSEPENVSDFWTESAVKPKTAAACLVLLAAILLALHKSFNASPVLHNPTTMFIATLCLLLGLSLVTPSVLHGFLVFYHRAIAPRTGAAGRLAGLNLQKNIVRNAVAASAIFFGISVYVSSACIVHSTKQSVLEWIDAYMRGDIVITSGHPIASRGAQNIPMPAEMREDIEKVPGVRSADPYRKIYMDYKGKRTLLQVLDIARRLEYSPFKMASGTRHDLLRLMPNQDQVAVNEAFASQEHLQPGDSMILPTPEGPVPFRVAAIVVDYSSDSGSILVDMHTYRRYWKESLADSFSVRVRSEADVGTVRDEISRRFGNDRELFVLPAREFRTEVRKVIDQSFSVIHAITVLSMLIAGLGIIVTLLASVLERTREIGILRSIGMLRNQVSRVVLIESAILGIIGGALGASAGSVIGWMSLEGFLRHDYGASMHYHIPAVSIFRAIAFSTLLAALAGLYPARRAAKTHIVEALSYE